MVKDLSKIEKIKNEIKKTVMNKPKKQKDQLCQPTSQAKVPTNEKITGFTKSGSTTDLSQIENIKNEMQKTSESESVIQKNELCQSASQGTCLTNEKANSFSKSDGTINLSKAENINNTIGSKPIKQKDELYRSASQGKFSTNQQATGFTKSGSTTELRTSKSWASFFSRGNNDFNHKAFSNE